MQRLAGLAGAALAVTLASPASAGGEIETAGQILRIALPVGAAGISFFRHDGDGVLQLGLSEAAAIGTSFLLSSVVKERRPDGTDMHSFPSDSTAVSFSAAAYLQRRYGWDYGLPAYALASFVGYSRVQSDRHHWHDVAAGAVIGWGASMLTTTRYAENVQIYVSSGYAGAPLGARLHMVW